MVIKLNKLKKLTLINSIYKISQLLGSYHNFLQKNKITKDKQINLVSLKRL